jgi:hypothetical protein
MPKIKSARFEITGSMRVKGRPVLAADGNICGYKQKDGSTVKLVAALEVENKDGTKYTYLCKDKEMRTLSFGIESYDRTDFIES